MQGIEFRADKVGFQTRLSGQYRLSGLLRSTMDTLCRELLDAVLGRLAMDDFPYSARFAVIDDASRQAVLAARQVARCFRD